MSSTFGPRGPDGRGNRGVRATPPRSTELQLFESLVFHLIEKGILTKNDALSVVQTVAEVKRGELEEVWPETEAADIELGALQRLYSSFEMLREKPSALRPMESENVVQLRPPLHRDDPDFPRDN